MITPPRHLSSHQWKDLTNGRTEAGSPIHHLPHNHCSSDQNISMFGCPVNRTFEHGKPEHLSTSDELNMDHLTLGLQTFLQQKTFKIAQIHGDHTD